MTIVIRIVVLPGATKFSTSEGMYAVMLQIYVHVNYPHLVALTVSHQQLLREFPFLGYLNNNYCEIHSEQVTHHNV